MRGTNQSSMRVRNERLVLSVLRFTSPLSRPEISRITGLTAQTISVIIRKLRSEGLLLAGEPVRGHVGQPSIPMELATDGAYFFGLFVGRRSSDFVLVDFLGNKLGQERTSYTYPNADEIVQFALRAFQTLSDQLGPDRCKKVSGIGVALPFRLWDWASELNVPKEKLYPWATRDIRSELEEALRLPAYLENDASAACAAQLIFGETRLAGDFLYFHVDYFIGGGVVLNRSLYTGQTGNAGALGSMPTVGENGRHCQLIDVASLATMEHMHIKAGQPDPELWRDASTWVLDERLVDKWCSLASNGLADAVTAAVSVIDFDAVLIDGRIPGELRTRLANETRRALKQRNFAGIEIPEVHEGCIGSDAPSLGAASLPLSNRFLVEGFASLQGGG